MNKESVMFGVIGLLAGVMIGFLLGNSVFPRGPAPVASAQPGATQNQQLPADHPPINNTTTPTGPDAAALQTAGKLAQDQPDNFDAQIAAGDLFYQAQKYSEALPFLLRAVTLRPDDYGAITRLGNVNFDAGNYPEAEKWYNSALAKKPDDINVRTDLGLTFMFRVPPDLDRAITEFQKSLSQDPNHLQTLQNLTVAFTKKGNAAQARATLAKLETVDPTNQALPTLRADIAKLDQPAAPTTATSTQHGPTQLKPKQ